MLLYFLLADQNMQKSIWRQQLQLSLLKASCVLFSNQENLRKILLQPLPKEQAASPADGQAAASSDSSPAKQSSREAAVGAEEEEGEEMEEPRMQLLMHQLMLAATQPSPVKAIFTRAELEAAVLTVCQHLTAEICHPNARTAPSPLVAAAAIAPEKPSPLAILSCPDQAHLPASPEPSPPLVRFLQKKKVKPAVVPTVPVVTQLVEMGFPRRKVEFAVKALGG